MLIETIPKNIVLYKWLFSNSDHKFTTISEETSDTIKMKEYQKYQINAKRK